MTGMWFNTDGPGPMVDPPCTVHRCAHQFENECGPPCRATRGPAYGRAGQTRAFVFPARASATPDGAWAAGVRWWDDTGRLAGIRVLGGYGTSWDDAARRGRAAVARGEREGWILAGTGLLVDLP